MSLSVVFKNLSAAQGSENIWREAEALRVCANKCWPLGERRGAHTKKMSPLGKFIKLVCFGISDCWVWRGRLEVDGYGTFGPKRAHRVSWEMTNGPIEDDLLVLHKCDLRSCVNPDHLFLGTQADNVADRERKGRGFRKKRNV